MPSEQAPFRPVTEDDKVDAIKTLAGGVAEIFGFASGLFVDRPGFIASTDSLAPLAQAVRAVSQFNCRQWAARDKSNYSTSVNIGNSNLCRPYLDSIGEGPLEGDIGQPWTGGFCTGTTYSVSLGATFSDYLDGVFLGNGTLPLTARGGVTFAGPVTGVVPVVESTGTTGLPQRWDIRISYGTGDTRNLTVQPTDRAPVSGRTERRINSYQAVFVRVSGGPDTCAPPTNQIQPPGSSPRTVLPPNITVNIPGLGPTTVTVTPGSDGAPTICIEELDVCIDVNLGEPGTPPTPPVGPPPGPGTAGTPSATGVGGDAEDEAPPGEMLWGLKIDITTISPNARQYAAGVYRAVCYVYMGDTDGLDHDPAGAMLRDGQFVLAERDYLTKWRVEANDGYNLFVTPYYKPQEAA